MKDLTKLSTLNIIANMTTLEQQIHLIIVDYNKMAQEMVRRMPKLQESNEFKPKVLEIRR